MPPRNPGTPPSSSKPPSAKMLGNISAAAAAGSTPPPPAFIYSYGGLGNTLALVLTAVFVFVLITFFLAFFFWYHLYLINPPPQNPNHSPDEDSAAAPNHVIFVVERGYRGDCGPPGLEDAVITSYPKFSFSVNGGCEGLCSICLNEYKEGQMLRRMPECPHCFHMQCIDSWLRLHGTCPVCRSSPATTQFSAPLTDLLSTSRDSVRF